MRFSKLFFIFTIFLFFAPTALFSQEALKSSEEEYYDFEFLQGNKKRPTLNYRTLSDNFWLDVTEKDEEGNEKSKDILWKNNILGTTFALWKTKSEKNNAYLRGIKRGVFLRAYGPEYYSSYNTTAPYGQNDGALWQGKGMNLSMTAGARLETYGVELTIKPQITFSQNKDFARMPGMYGNEYSYFWKGNIDLPQRFGSGPYWQFDFGDTELRYTWRTITVGVGFQSPWLGPAWLNPMLGSNNAPTYPKIDIGLRRQRIVIPKVNVYLGDIEARIWFGCLSESKYFDNNSDNDHRMIVGFSLAYAPSFIPGLTLFINKICVANWKDKSIKYFNPFYDTNGSYKGADEDQKFSFGIDWAFPKIGFEVYAEIGKDDYSAREIENPFHTLIYTVGAKKTIPIVKKWGIFGEIIFEWNQFEMSQDFQLQWPYMGFYAHGSISQGYTQKGQIIGAGSGTFGNSQYLAFRVYHKKGSVTLFAHFNRPDSNYIHNLGVSTKQDDWTSQGKRSHEFWSEYKTYMTFGGRLQYFPVKSLLLTLEVNGSRITRMTYASEDGDSASNVNIIFGAKYNF